MGHRRRAVALVVLAAAVLSAGLVPEPAIAASLGAPLDVDPGASSGPTPKFACTFTGTLGAFAGDGATAAAIGWAGNSQGVPTCLGANFVVQDDLYVHYGFGIYGGSPTTWTDASGWLPAQITSFHRGPALVTITEFADRDVIAGHPFVAVYCRVAVKDPTSNPLIADPGASSGLVALNAASDVVEPHRSVDHDYVVASDRFGGTYPWPTATQLARAGSFDAHYAHMRRFWTTQVAAIAQLGLPDAGLVERVPGGLRGDPDRASGRPAPHGGQRLREDVQPRRGGDPHQPVHPGVLHGRVHTAGFHRDAVGTTPTGYVDGLWLYPVPWAVYVMKTGDLALARANFATAGPAGATEPSIEDAAHTIAADRTGPTGTMEATDDIDTVGYWTDDDLNALLGLAAYRYLATRLGERSEVAWASAQLSTLQAATDSVLSATIARSHLNYLPCSLVQPNPTNRCSVPTDANWTSPLGDWAWLSTLLGTKPTGPAFTMIDATYAYGFDRLAGTLPSGTTGGFPDDWYSSAYDAAMGTAGLEGSGYRDQGIVNYEFMVENTQSGPNAWWESASAPGPSPWLGRHPASGQGSSPHAWGMAGANAVLLGSLVAQRAGGSLVVGRGVPGAWLSSGTSITVSNFPAAGGRRIGLALSARGRSVSLSLSGKLPPGPTVLALPSFLKGIAATSTGHIDAAAGTVTLSPGTRSVTVTLRHPPA